jgi:hypothetical protein
MSDDNKADEKIGTFQELLDTDWPPGTTIRFGNGPAIPIHSKKELEKADPISSFLQ